MPSARIGEGVVVMARVVVSAEARVDDLAILNTGAVVEHDNHIGAAAHVAPLAALAGNVRVGARALVGVGSAIRPGITVGEDAVVGAGSAVVADVPAGATVGGVPARALSPARARGREAGMKIGLVSSAVPLVFGGGRFIVDWLREKLEERGHAVETVFIPTADNPDTVLQQMAAFRLMRLENHFERVITFRPPAHVVRHPCKVVWFIHHMRYFYDLWDTEYRPLRRTSRRTARCAPRWCAPTRRRCREARPRLHQLPRGGRPRAALQRARKRGPLPARAAAGALRRRRVRGRDRLRVPGRAPQAPAPAHRGDAARADAGPPPALRHRPRRRLHPIAPPLGGRERRGRPHRHRGPLDHRGGEGGPPGGALASAYVPYDEDSYGYPTIEAAHARRCTVTVSDAGGVAEFVRDGETGLVAAPEPVALAAAFDRLHADRALARRLGANAAERVAELGIDWDTVIEKLLA